MKTISRYIMTLALLITAASGAWAQATFGVKEITPDMVPDSWNGDNSEVTAADLANWGFKEVTEAEAKTWTGAPQQVTARLIYTISSGCESLDWEGGVQNGGSSYIRHNVIYLLVRNPDYSSQYDFFITTEPTTEETTNAEAPIEVTTNAASEGATFTEAWFAMPTFDATVDYEIVRDLADRTAANITVGEGQEAETLEADSRLRIQKTDNGYVFVNPLAISFSDELENVTIAKDGFETAKLVPQFYLQQDDAQNPWTLVPDDNLDDETGLPNNLQPGQVYCVTFVPGEGSAYDGETPQSVTITLFEGYEVEVPAGEFATYYRDDDNLVLDDQTTGAKLYTITTVNGSTATVTEITSANKEMPFLIYNSSDEAKTFLLIPTESVTNQSFYSGFIGTAEATTIAASDASANRYAFNGKQFVWVKNAIAVGANKAWLQISNTNARTITLVFDEATGVNAVDNGQLTIDNDGWYDLNGRKLEGMPTRKGVYIINGRKVVIK